MKPHYITSKAELRQILSDVGYGRLSQQEAFESIDLTISQANLAFADWVEKFVKDIRDSNKKEDQS